MIDMRPIKQNNLYKELVKYFLEIQKQPENLTDENWTLFKNVFLTFTNNLCPICEKGELDQYCDIDHYRPTSKYNFLEFDYKNYMIMCKSCNTGHKNGKFPLHNEAPRAQQIDDIKYEIPLLINPMEDDIFHFFKLKFKKYTPKGAILVLEPNIKIIGKKSIDYKRAKKTIEVYGLDETATDGYKIGKMKKNLIKLYYLAETFYKNDTKKILQTFKSHQDECIERKKLGFFIFISKKQFDLSDFTDTEFKDDEQVEIKKKLVKKISKNRTEGFKPCRNLEHNLA